MGLPETSPTSLLMATFKQNHVLLSDMRGVGDVVSVFACDPFHTTRAGLLVMQKKLRTPRELSIPACSLNGIFRKVQTDHSRPTVLSGSSPLPNGGAARQVGLPALGTWPLTSLPILTPYKPTRLVKNYPTKCKIRL